MKILLVDDDAFLREMYVTKFVEHGDSVDTVENGKAALAKLAKESYDVVLMDMIMPGMTGTELITAIKNNEATKEVKCIVLSNQGEPSDIDGAERAGAIGFIIKAELIPGEVVNKVHSLII